MSELKTEQKEQKPKKKLVIAKNKTEATWAVIIFGAFILLSLYNVGVYVQSQIKSRQTPPPNVMMQMQAKHLKNPMTPMSKPVEKPNK